MQDAPQELTWVSCRFDEMTPHQVYSLLKLRQQIFIIEQECIFPEIDGLDPLCDHIIALDGETVLAAVRIVGPGIVRDQRKPVVVIPVKNSSCQFMSSSLSGY